MDHHRSISGSVSKGRKEVICQGSGPNNRTAMPSGRKEIAPPAVEASTVPPKPEFADTAIPLRKVFADSRDSWLNPPEKYFPNPEMARNPTIRIPITTCLEIEANKCLPCAIKSEIS